jgi:hypothetical protein
MIVDPGSIDRERIDFMELDPLRDSTRFDRIARRIRRAATAELVRRQSTITPFGALALIVRWWGPVAAAAALIMVLSAAVFMTVRPSSSGHSQTRFAVAVGMPSELARWARTGGPTGSYGLIVPGTGTATESN